LPERAAFVFNLFRLIYVVALLMLSMKYKRHAFYRNYGEEQKEATWEFMDDINEYDLFGLTALHLSEARFVWIGINRLRLKDRYYFAKKETARVEKGVRKPIITWAESAIKSEKEKSEDVSLLAASSRKRVESNRPH
jgi:hypothetical protein